MFGVGPAGANDPAEKETAAPPPDETPDFPERKPWDARIPDPPAGGNGSSGSDGSAAPTGWPPSPASASGDAGSSSGPGAPPISDRYSPADSSFGSDSSFRGDSPYGSGGAYGSDAAYGGGTGTSQFPRPLTKGRIRPARPSKPSRGNQSGSQRPASFPTQGAGSSRKAQLAISRIEPWSVMKFSFMFSLVGWVILFVAVAVMYFVIQKLGVFTSIEHTVGLVTSTKTSQGTNAASWFSASRVLGYTMLVGAVNVVLITALATIGAVLYNLITIVAGGIEVTLKEAE